MIVGVDRDLGGLQARVETYYKGFSDLITGRLETEEERLAESARYNFPAALASSVPTAALITAVPTNDSTGRAYGVEMFLTRPGQRVPSAAHRVVVVLAGAHRAGDLWKARAVQL
jgi:hypothetical protein